MGTLGYKYVLYGYMEPLGKMPGFRVYASLSRASGCLCLVRV